MARQGGGGRREGGAGAVVDAEGDDDPNRPRAARSPRPHYHAPLLSSPQLEQEPMPAPSSLVAPPQDDLERLSVEAAPHAEPPNEYDEQMASAHLVASLVADAERALAAVLMSPAPRLRF